MKNYYEILEVSPRASIDVIERAYKVLVKKNHPDGKEISEEKIKDINEAYAVLSNDFLREQYDKELENTKVNNMYYTNTENNRQNYKKSSVKQETEEKYKDPGSFYSIIEIIKNIYSNRPDIRKIKDLDKKDYMSIGITILIMIVILLILWAIPFTRNFVTDITRIFTN